MMTVFVQRGVTPSNIMSMTRKLLRSSGFSSTVKRVVRSENDPIVIKPNIATVSQVNYFYGTDPRIVTVIVDELRSMGYGNITIVEAQCNLSLGNACLTPDRQAMALRYDYPVMDLTATELVPLEYLGKTVYLSKVMLDAAFIINVPKTKNHDLMLMTGALKNMYGSIPDRNKYRLFHKRASGLYIDEVTYFVNVTTPPDYSIVDFVQSIDGQEESLYRLPVKGFKYYPAGRLVAGTDSLEIDKYISLKMGYEQNESPIVRYFASRAGDFDIHGRKIIGDDLEPINEEGRTWRRISWLKKTIAKTQDKLPVNDKVVSAGMRGYYYDVCKTPDDEKKKKKSA